MCFIYHSDRVYQLHNMCCHIQGSKWHRNHTFCIIRVFDQPTFVLRSYIYILTFSSKIWYLAQSLFALIFNNYAWLWVILGYVFERLCNVTPLGLCLIFNISQCETCCLLFFSKLNSLSLIAMGGGGGYIYLNGRFMLAIKLLLFCNAMIEFASFCFTNYLFRVQLLINKAANAMTETSTRKMDLKLDLEFLNDIEELDLSDAEARALV